MDLLKAVQSQPFEKIKELIGTKWLPIDTTSWSDYEALNWSIVKGRRDVALFLIEKKCRVNKISRLLTKPSSTPLHNAILLADIELVQKLLEKNASMTAVDSKEDSPLHLAFILNYDKITDLILDFILQTATFANPKNHYGLTHFHVACARKNENLIVSYMKIKSNLEDIVSKDSPYYPGYTIMHFAVESQCPLILKLLLERTGKFFINQAPSVVKVLKKYVEDMSVMNYMLSSYNRIHLEPRTSMSQFHIACMQGNSSLVNTFLYYGAVVNDPLSEDAPFCPSYSPLHLAVESNCKETVKLLLQHGADADFQNTNFMTPLHLSMYNDNQEITDLLYAAKKNKVIDRNDRNGLNYFHVAVAKNDIETVNKFLDRGQDVNARVFQNNRNFSGYTPLHFAVRYKQIRMAKLLIENGANINASDMVQHGTPLHMALSAGHRGLIELFLKIGVRVDIKRPHDGKTMLHLLVETYMNGEKRSMILDYVSKFVLDYGLDINAKDNEGYTALHYACTKISIGADCAKVLLEYGADINIENNVGDTPFELSFYDIYRNNAADYFILYNHVKGLKTLGLQLNPKNEECCQKLFREKNECEEGADCFRTMHIVKKQQESVNEILKMKRCMVSKNVSLYQFVLMNEKQLKHFGGTDTLKRFMEGKMINEFVTFGYLVKVQWSKLQKMVSNAKFS